MYTHISLSISLSLYIYICILVYFIVRLLSLASLSEASPESASLCARQSAPTSSTSVDMSYYIVLFYYIIFYYI